MTKRSLGKTVIAFTGVTAIMISVAEFGQAADQQNAAPRTGTTREPITRRSVDLIDRNDSSSRAIARAFDSFALAEATRSSGRTLIVRTNAENSAALKALDQDITIMGRILEKAVDESSESSASRRGQGLNIVSIDASRGARNMYIQGTGALFLLSAGFPLVQPPVEGENKEKVDENAEWEETKSELYGGRRRYSHIYQPIKRREYDAKRVEDLKNSLIEALKNAANIKALQTGESVTIVVSGTGADTTSGLAEFDDRADRQARENADSTMVIRAAKEDIDAFAKKKMDSKEFRGKVIALTY